MTAALTATEPLPVPRAGIDYAPAFAAITPERLRELLYGELQTAEDLAELETIAAATGADPVDLIPATGEPGHDPRTGLLNPRSVCEKSLDEDTEGEAGEGYDPETVLDEFRSVIEDDEFTTDDVGEESTAANAAVGIHLGPATATVDANLLADLDVVSARNPEIGRWFAARLRQRGLLPEGVT